MDILIVDDDASIRDATSQIVEREGHYSETASDAATALRSLAEASFDLVLLDMNLGRDNGLVVLEQIQKTHPRVAVVIFTGQGTISTAVEAMRLGALDYLEKPFTRAQLALALSRVQKHRQLAQKVVELETRVSYQEPAAIFETKSPAVRDVLETLFRAASTPASILIMGESGTGKTIAARAVHQQSDRAAKPFVTIHCPSLSRELLESELFGHVRGAFTGALRDHWGKVRAADGGTLFLDEIGQLPQELQPKLLRLLQDREYERVGETATHHADVRVIAATNSDLEAAVAEDTFREDLFYRLNVISVFMPPLRERIEDLMDFAQGFLEFFATTCSSKVKGFSDEARLALLKHSWPGNLRELRNVVERAVILTRSPMIMLADLPPPLNAGTNGTAGSALSAGQFITVEALEADHIRRVLSSTESLNEAAEVLGIDQATLYRKRKKLGLD